jgi:hypothetical protein
VEEEIEQIYADNGVLGAKNLLNNEAVSQTSSGVTITVNSDKSITTTGTNSSSTTSVEFPIVAKTSISSIKNGMILSGSKDFNSGLWGMAISYYNSSGTYIGQQNCFADGVVLSIPSNAVQYRIFMFVKPSQTISNKTAYPMIRLASDPDDTYQPYAMTNRELTEKKINIADLKTVVSASSDFADFKTRIASL